jgi:GDPmannose 4,6-dehydratase
MLQQDKPDDYVIAIGESHSLEEFVAAAFTELGLDWREHVTIDPEFFRPTEISVSRGNPEKSRQVLGWQARNKMAAVVRLMCQDELRRQESHG